MCGFESRLQHFYFSGVVMPYPSQIVDNHEMSAVFEDHLEHIYLGAWKELIIGQLRLVRREDGTIEVEQLEEEFVTL
jgi:hypothetical protein